MSEKKQKKKKNVRWITHYNSEQKILLVGEGDLSFSACLARAFGSGLNMVSTSLHSQELLKAKYWSSEANVDNLERLGCRVLHEVDVKEMRNHPILKQMKFDIVVYNFPHAGHFYGYTETDEELIQMHKELLRAFFLNARGMLNQGGEVHVSHREDYPYSTWGLGNLAANEVTRKKMLIHRLVPLKLLNPRWSAENQVASSCSSLYPREMVNVLYTSYQLMERMFRIYIYEEGEPPLFHTGPCKDIYSIEGIFINLMETNARFRTRDPDRAHVYYLPFSLVMILDTPFDPINGSTVNAVAQGPRATWNVHQLYFTSIRVLCNANTLEHFNPKKDASFPEINLKIGEIEGLTGGLPASNLTVLAFFAGSAHGKIRPAFLKHWMEKDEDIRIYKNLREGISYPDMMKKSRYCICPSGWEVTSPRIVEAINAECVPVLISQNYVLPFSDVLNWNLFSVQVSVGEIPNLKKILVGIPEDQYPRLQEGVRQVQSHFLVNDPPKRFDVFHMIIHSIWLRRLNVAVYK